MNRESLPLTSINIGDRVRTDYGDLPGLMASILKHGLIQPVVVDQSNNLIAGGRRYYSHCALVEAGHTQFSSIEVVRKQALSDAELREMELEENFQRKDMTWQEYAIGIYHIHRIKSANAAANGDQWTQEHTAISIGQSRQRVTQVLPVARELVNNPDSPLHKEPTFDAALKRLLLMREQEAKSLLAKQSLSVGGLQLGSTITGRSVTPLNISPIPSELQTSPDQRLLFQPESGPIMLETDSSRYDVPTDHPTAPRAPQVIDINLADYFFNESCLDFMSRQPEESVDHIITDPPYAIDMDNLQQEAGHMDVSITAAEHKVGENIELLFNFIPAAFRMLKPKGFLVMFCDAEHFQWLMERGIEAGFSVQRWPVVWCKVSAKNEAAGFNFTKATEFAVAMRKKGGTLIEHQPLNWRCISKGPADKDFDHPFAKPRELWTWMINAVSTPGQLIYEPFCGSGSCVASLIATGRKWIATEVGEQHKIEALRNITKAIMEHFQGLGVQVNIHYTPRQ